MRQGLKAIIYGSAVVGFGYALMVFTTPTEEQLVARLSPDLKAKYYANKEAQNSRFTHQIQEAAAEKKPIWLKDPKDVLSKPIDNTVDASVLDEQKRLKKLSEEGK